MDFVRVYPEKIIFSRFKDFCKEYSIQRYMSTSKKKIKQQIIGQIRWHLINHQTTSFVTWNKFKTSPSTVRIYISHCPSLLLLTSHSSHIGLNLRSATGGREGRQVGSILTLAQNQGVLCIPLSFASICVSFWGMVQNYHCNLR